MKQQILQLSGLTWSSVFYCSKKQLLELVQTQDTAQAPQQKLTAMRSEVPYYKESTLRFAAKAIGVTALFCVLFFFVFFGEDVYYFTPVFAPFVFALFPVFLWPLMNGGALANLSVNARQRHPLSKAQICGVIVPHVVYAIFVCAACFALTRDSFFTTPWFEAFGLSAQNFSRFLPSVVRVVNVVSMLVLFFSLFQMVRVSAVYFTVTCHSVIVLFLSHMFEHIMRTLTTKDNIVDQLSKAFPLYYILVAVSACVCLLYWQLMKHSKKPQMVVA